METTRPPTEAYCLLCPFAVMNTSRFLEFVCLILFVTTMSEMGSCLAATQLSSLTIENDGTPTLREKAQFTHGQVR